MKILWSLCLCILSVSSLSAQEGEHIYLGTSHQLYSEVLGENREYWISLPESYDDANSEYKRYPVLVVLDGRAHFKSVTGTVNYLSSGYNGNLQIPEMIVVAIRNVNRRRDFTPDKIVTTRANDSGGGKRFLSFLEEELLPDIDTKFRTQPYRILFGHSLGGLIAIHAYMTESTSFSSFIAADPSFGTWDPEVMDGKLDTISSKSFDRFLYIATANWGKRNIRNRDRHVRFYESLNSLSEGELRSKLEYFEDENHGSIPPQAFYEGITSIFDGYGIYYRDIESAEQLKIHFQGLSERLSFSFYPPEDLVNRVAYMMLRNEGQRDEAIELFELNTANYPGSYNAFDSLGEAYERIGDKDKAIVNYKKSLELNPDNEHARNKIDTLSID